MHNISTAYGRAKISEAVLFIAFFGTSIVGAKIGRLSLNKIAILPLFAWLMGNGYSQHISKRTNIIIALYISMLASCIVALLRTDDLSNRNGYYSTIINYVIQIVIFYIPLCIFMASKRNKALVGKGFRKIIVLVVRIHSIWALLQEAFYIGMGVSINDILFGRILAGFGFSEWTAYVLFDRLYIRVSGLNVDPAYLGILLIFGILLDDKFIYKVLYAILCLLTFSRTTLIGFFIAIFTICFREKIISKKMILTILVIFLASGMMFVVPKTNNLLMKMISRFDFIHQDISNWSISSMRHILYYPYAIIVHSRSNLIEKLLGFGPRVDGIAFTKYNDVINGLGLYGTNLTDIWAAESDFIGLLLGCGILGLILYYMLLLNLYKKADSNYKSIIICIFAMGLMYNYYSLTIVNLFYIICCADTSVCALKRFAGNNRMVALKEIT